MPVPGRLAFLLVLLVAMSLAVGSAWADDDDDDGGGGGNSGQGGGGSNGGGGGGGSSQAQRCSEPRPSWWPRDQQWPPKPWNCPVAGAPGAGTSPPATSTQPAPEATQPAPGDPAAPAPDATEAPVLGRTLGVAVAAGEVRIRLAGTDLWIALEQDVAVPTGTLIDARRGSVTLSAAVDDAGRQQAANFSGAVFTARQTARAGGLTELRLSGGDFSSCPRAPQARDGRAAIAAAAARRRRGGRAVRRLWGSGHGRFRTRGRHSAATVRGTIWLTEDRCGSTVTSVRRGVVDVRDLGRRRTVRLTAGERYVAAPSGR